MTTTEVLAAANWANNAELVADVAKMGWLDGKVLDLTYGMGKFWSVFEPDALTKNDVNPDKGDHHYRAQQPPLKWVNSFDAVVFDPPYRMSGRPDSAMGSQYGIDVPRSKYELLGLLADGTRGAAACVKKGGWLHVKCQAQINGGKYVDQPRLVVDTVTELGTFTYRAPWYLMSVPIPQPAGRRQLNPRNNVSVLLSFQRDR